VFVEFFFLDLRGLQDDDVAGEHIGQVRGGFFIPSFLSFWCVHNHSYELSDAHKTDVELYSSPFDLVRSCCILPVRSAHSSCKCLIR
jgi:hypothetical protein